MNKTISLAAITLVAVVMGLSALAPAEAGIKLPNDDEESPDVKVTICHIPPGNPDNPQIISINVEDLEEHLDEHEGDFVILNEEDIEDCLGEGT